MGIMIICSRMSGRIAHIDELEENVAYYLLGRMEYSEEEDCKELIILRRDKCYPSLAIKLGASLPKADIERLIVSREGRSREPMLSLICADKSKIYIKISDVAWRGSVSHKTYADGH